MMMNRNKFKLFSIVGLILLVALGCGIFSSPVITAPQSMPAVAPPTISPIQVSAPLITTSEEGLLVDLYKRVNPAVVTINTYGMQDAQATGGEGSGFVFDSNGDIVTNAHVVHGASDLEVVFSDESIEVARLVGEDLHSDLAVIHVDNLPEGVQPLPLGDINKVAVGQTVVAIGNPFGLGGTLTKGIVSALGRNIPALTAFQIPQSIQTDAPINPGNSGGPLLNLQGEVIGVNAQIETDNGSRVNSGVGFAVPVSIVARVVPELIKNRGYEWAWMGVSGGSVNPTLVEAMKLSVDRGAYIAEVIRGGPASKADLHGAGREIEVNGRPVSIGGDVITAINGVSVGSFEDLLIYIALNTSPGQEVTLTILRDGQVKDVKVKLEARPKDMLEIPRSLFPNP